MRRRGQTWLKRKEKWLVMLGVVLIVIYMLIIFNIYFKSPHYAWHGSRHPPATTPLAAPQPKSPSPPHSSTSRESDLTTWVNSLLTEFNHQPVMLLYLGHAPTIVVSSAIFCGKTYNKFLLFKDTSSSLHGGPAPGMARANLVFLSSANWFSRFLRMCSLKVSLKDRMQSFQYGLPICKQVHSLFPAPGWQNSMNTMSLQDLRHLGRFGQTSRFCNLPLQIKFQ
ncbi:hypothetical protein TB2_030387 [Malus domestica]